MTVDEKFVHLVEAEFDTPEARKALTSIRRSRAAGLTGCSESVVVPDLEIPGAMVVVHEMASLPTPPDGQVWVVNETVPAVASGLVTFVYFREGLVGELDGPRMATLTGDGTWKVEHVGLAPSGEFVA